MIPFPIVIDVFTVTYSYTAFTVKLLHIPVFKGVW
jgi:hypothetical protein